MGFFSFFFSFFFAFLLGLRGAAHPARRTVCEGAWGFPVRCGLIVPQLRIFCIPIGVGNLMIYGDLRGRYLGRHVAVVSGLEAWKWKHVGHVGTPGARPVNGVCKKGY